METRTQALQRTSGDCTPSEGEQKTPETNPPSEGGKRRLETKTRVQALQRASGDYAPPEGEQKTRENHSPSEGEQKTRLYPPDQTRYLLCRPDIVALGDVDDAAEGVGYH